MIKIYVYDKKNNLIDYHFVNSLDDLIGIYVNQDVVFAETEYVNPVIENGKLREMTIKELKLSGKIQLGEGEKIVNEEIELVTSPGEFYSWNYESLEWQYDEDKKQAKINEINQHAYYEIVEKYPLWKQMNITRIKDYNEETLAEYNSMITFIDELRAWADYEILMLG